MGRIRLKLDSEIWTRNLILFAVAFFFVRFGEGLLGGARMNYFVDTLGLGSGQVLWLEGLRELPGLGLIFVAAFTMHLPLSRQGALSVLLMGVGYLLYAFVGSYTALIGAAIVASFGFHMWAPLHGAIGMSLSSKENAGRVMGSLAAVGALAAIFGMGGVSLVSWLFEEMSLTVYYLVGGVFIILSSILIFRLPTDIGVTETKPPRILIKRRYWLYYVLIFFAGARKLILGSFVTLVLVQDYDLKVWQISALTLVSSVVSFLLTPYLGTLIDRLGERVVTPAAYALLALSCVGYAMAQQAWILIALWMLIKLTLPLSMALSTYVYRTAPQEELAPTLTAGVTFDHISSVGMPFLAGALLPIINYEGVFLGTAVLILISIPFARALQVRTSPALQPASTTQAATAGE